MATKHKFITYGQGPNGVEWRWINYFKTAGDFTPTDTQLVTWITAAWDLIKTNIATNWNVYQVGYSPWIGTDDHDTKGWGATVVHSMTPIAGTNATESLPAQSAVCLLGRTATKRVIGKKYVPGLAENTTASGVLAAGALTGMQNLAGFFYASTYNMGGTGLTPCTWGKYHGFVETISSSVSPYLGTQRRRKPGVGI